VIYTRYTRVYYSRLWYNLLLNIREVKHGRAVLELLGYTSNKKTEQKHKLSLVI